MKAARYHFPEQGNAPAFLRVEEVDAPMPAPGEVRLRVAYAGICGSDLARYRQLPNHPRALYEMLGSPSPIPGHEFSGTVDLLGEGVADKWSDGTAVPGSRVVAHPQVGCGECASCRAGYWTGCSKQGSIRLIGLHRDGAYAEYVNVPFDHLVRLPHGLSTRDAALAEPIAVAIHSLQVAGSYDLAQPIAVIGDGTIGLITAHLLANAGATKVALIGRHAQRMALAPALGVDDLRTPEQLGEEESEQWPLVMLTAGSQGALELALRIAARGGKIVTIGYLHEGDAGVNVPLFFQLIRREKTLVGACGSTLAELGEAVQMLASGAVNADALIGGVIPLEEIVADGFEALTGPTHSAGKILVEIQALQPKKRTS